MVTEQAIKLNISRALRPLGSLRWSRFMDTEYPAWTSMLLMVFSKSLGEDDAVPTADPGNLQVVSDAAANKALLILVPLCLLATHNPTKTWQQHILNSRESPHMQAVQVVWILRLCWDMTGTLHMHI